PADVVASFAGVRPLYDDGDAQASDVTRDYVLDLHDRDGAPALSVYGGKLTTYRHLADSAMEKLAPVFPDLKPSWTATAPLPGGELGGSCFREFTATCARLYSWLPADLLKRYCRAYGDRIHFML